MSENIFLNRHLACFQPEAATFSFVQRKYPTYKLLMLKDKLSFTRLAPNINTQIKTWMGIKKHLHRDCHRINKTPLHILYSNEGI